MSEYIDDIYEETQRARLLSLIAVCGELPVDQICRLPGGERYKQNMIVQLKKRKQIKTFYKDGLRGYRLLLPTKELLLRQNPNRFNFYLTGVNETNHIRSEITRRSLICAVVINSPLPSAGISNRIANNCSSLLSSRKCWLCCSRTSISSRSNQ